MIQFYVIHQSAGSISALLTREGQQVIESGHGIPPAVAILLNEHFSILDRSGARRKLKSMVRDIKDQTLAEIERAPRSVLPNKASASSDFTVFLDSGLDLFSLKGACVQLQCRLGYAEQIARSIALMSDSVWFHDYFTERVFDLGRATNEKLDRLLDDVFVLQRLRPLIEVGIAKFHSPLIPLCAGCSEEFERKVEALSMEVFAQVEHQMRVERISERRVYIHTGPTYEPSVVLHASGDFSRATDAEILQGHVYSCVRSTMWTARDASTYDGAVFSNSRVGLSGILKQEGRYSGRDSPRLIEGARAGNLPWVAGLTIEQTIQLRHEAGSALPRLREFLAKHLSAGAEVSNPTNQNDFVAELRSQAEEVKAELKAVSTGNRHLARNALGVLGLGIFAYGFASESTDTATGLGSLLTLLGLLHTVNMPDKQHAAIQKSKPGYVLVAAQSLLQHAPSTDHSG